MKTAAVAAALACVLLAGCSQAGTAPEHIIPAEPRDGVGMVGGGGRVESPQPDSVASQGGAVLAPPND